MIIQEGRNYRARNGEVLRNARAGTRTPGPAWLLDRRPDGGAIPYVHGYDGDGTPYGTFDPDLILIEQVIGDADQPFVPDWAQKVEAEAAHDQIVADYRERVRNAKPLEVIWNPSGLTADGARKIVEEVAAEKRAAAIDVKVAIADEAKRIVSGARRSAYGNPENNFERIARFWDAYFKNTGRDITITAADVSPMMRLMKEARLCETPDHRDSFVDLIGYTLTGAEVNKVKANAA